MRKGFQKKDLKKLCEMLTETEGSAPKTDAEVADRKLESILRKTVSITC